MYSNIKHTPYLAIHIGWDDLSNIASQRMSELTGKQILASADREDYYYWGFSFDETPLDEDEYEKLLADVKADDYDKDVNNFDESPITEFSQNLAAKVLEPLFPYPVFSSHADNDGVWLLFSYNDTNIRSATIEGDNVRDTQVFSGDPSSKEDDDNARDFMDVKYPNLFVGIYEGATEEEICKKAASSLGVHPDIITLTEINLF